MVLAAELKVQAEKENLEAARVQEGLVPGRRMSLLQLYRVLVSLMDRVGLGSFVAGMGLVFLDKPPVS